VARVYVFESQEKKSVTIKIRSDEYRAGLWRICFRWVARDAEDVELVHYKLTLAKIRREPIMGQLRNPHPGEILKEEFLNEIGVRQNQLAQAIGGSGNRFRAIFNGTRAITADRDLRLCKFFGLTDGYFMRL
jgi:addiction module HigA family antidote